MAHWESFEKASKALDEFGAVAHEPAGSEKPDLSEEDAVTIFSSQSEALKAACSRLVLAMRYVTPR